MKKTKQECRRRVCRMLEQLDDKTKKTAEQAIIEKLESLPCYQQATSIMAYASHRHEINTLTLLERMLRSNKTLYLPKVDAEQTILLPMKINDLEKDIVRGYQGILEPAAHCVQEASFSTDIIIVPGVAFNQAGYRLGRGKGFYDRFLSEYPNTFKICLAFDEQLIESLPIEDHDEKLDLIITPTRFIECGCDDRP